MKSKEQVELAQETIKNLQDYVELAKTYKRLKKSESKEIVENQIEQLINESKNLIKSL